MSSTKLHAALLWREGGHLTDEALVAIADGQDLLPADATAHAFECEDCAHRLGEAALFSVDLGGSLAEALAEAPAMSAAPVSASPRLAPPWWALVFGLGFVGVGAAPFLLGVPAWLPRAGLVLQRSVPVFAHGLVRLFAGFGGDALPRAMVSVVALVVVMTSAFAMSRLAPREDAEVAP